MNEIGRIDYGPEEAAMQAYLKAGAERAQRLGNRGPVRFTADGRIPADILDAYWRTGFYVFENVIDPVELADIEAGMKDVLRRLPREKGATVDAEGRPALGAGSKAPALFWSRPLADPFGGTDLANGRHPVKMYEPKPDDAAPKEVVYLILGSLQFADAALRLYGHPKLLAIAAAVNGEDFVPFNEAIFIKEPGRGASVAWHQDGVTHWTSPDWDMGSHGFNFMAQVYGCTPANGVWVVPGSHAMGKVDIKKMIAEAGTERLPDAVPIVCAPGDVAITNRQTVHGSFANTSPDWRITLNMGFHRRRSVLGVTGGGLHNAVAVYDNDRIHRRARLLGYAMDARRQRFPDETPYAYAPLAGETYSWDDAARADIRDYNLEDLSI
ncbi:MAG TPA: phytanoyl-CoA dioxygenase family protein [Rhodopila sp.]|jgi:ectoine hydroxylase-related dioxygenase (phytanoyl-CoA dioxygenase family)|nr:phytanoyl-CoA dioxygenase family protein [Rhodopila sp.]